MIKITDNDIVSRFAARPDTSIDFKQAKEQYSLHPERWDAAFKFLCGSDLASIPLGLYHIQGDDVYANVQEYNPKILGNTRFESHKKYIDLQYVIKGGESIKLRRGDDYKPSDVDDDKDISFYDLGDGSLLQATPERYFVFFPSDLHRPCIDNGKDSMVRKVVVKIRCE